MAVPSRHAGAPAPFWIWTSIDACVASAETTVMLMPPAGSVKVLPMPRPASVKPAVPGAMSSSQVCRPLWLRVRRSPATWTSTVGASP
jgi:hypothetical protein